MDWTTIATAIGGLVAVVLGAKTVQLLGIVKAVMEIVAALIRGIEAGDTAGPATEPESVKGQVANLMVYETPRVRALFDKIKKHEVG